jgi:hypothetical protein
MKKSDEERREEAILAINLWKESKLTQGEFCRREKIARSTFQHWRRRYDPDYVFMGKKKQRSKRKPQKKERFIPVEPVPLISASVDTQKIKTVSLDN